MIRCIQLQQINKFKEESEDKNNKWNGKYCQIWKIILKCLKIQRYVIFFKPENFYDFDYILMGNISVKNK